jgi:formate hydrogenlyase subunit 3/multisubunit Na+/H+ antiporter MnhD subunit
MVVLILMLSAIFLPLALAPLIYLAGEKSARLRNALAVLGSAAALLCTAALYFFARSGALFIFPLAGSVPLTLSLERTGLLLALITSFLYLLVTVYSIDYMANPGAGNLYYPVLSLTLGACLGIFFSGDFFVLFLFFQLVVIATYLIIVNRQSPQAYLSGARYLALAVGSGVVLLAGAAAVYGITGSALFSAAGFATAPGWQAVLIFACFMISFGVMALAHPFIIWRQDAYPLAPSPATALLAAVMLKIATYGMLRVISDLYGVDFMRENGVPSLLLSLALLLIASGICLTYKQGTIKGRMAYSTLIQQGYILLNLALFAEKTTPARIHQLFFYVFILAALFLSSGALIWRTGKNNIHDLARSGWQVPVTLVTFTNAAALSFLIPLYKGAVMLAAAEPLHWAYLAALLLVALSNACFYLPLTIRSFGVRHSEMNPPRGGAGGQVIVLPAKGVTSGGKTRYVFTLEAPVRMLVAMIVLNISCIVFALLSI